MTPDRLKELADEAAKTTDYPPDEARCIEVTSEELVWLVKNSGTKDPTVCAIADKAKAKLKAHAKNVGAVEQQLLKPQYVNPPKHFVNGPLVSALCEKCADKAKSPAPAAVAPPAK